MAKYYFYSRYLSHYKSLIWSSTFDALIERLKITSVIEIIRANKKGIGRDKCDALL